MVVALAMLFLGYGVIGLCVLILSKELHKAYPFGSSNKFWWSKYLPIIGFSLMLMAAVEGPTLALALGLIVIIVSALFLPKSRANNETPSS